MLQDTIYNHTSDFLAASGQIIITMHQKPDGDAMGSALGFKHIFAQLGISSKVVSPTDFAEFLNWMPGCEDVQVFEKNGEALRAEILNASFIFCLDFNSISRLEDMSTFVEKSKAKVIMIDHHQDPQEMDDSRFCNVQASSTCELIFDFAFKHLKLNELSPNAAQCLYTGIVTDTGSFRYRSTTKHTMEVASKLLDFGASPEQIYNEIFDQNELIRLQLLGYFLSERLQLVCDGKVAISFLTEKDLAKYAVKTGDTEGFVNYGLSIKGVSLSAMFVKRTNVVKISFRSKTDFPCNQFAAKYFSGGGHKNAAGGSSKNSIEETMALFNETINEFKNYL